MDTSVHDDVTSFRESIDDIDSEIAKLLIRRRQASQSVQRVKLSNGLALTDLNREGEVFGHYRLLLGDHGPSVAAIILNFCK